jgi:hypothetical protein
VTVIAKYPTPKEIEKASHEQICRWRRFLPSPATDEQVAVLERIEERFKHYGGFTSEISKKIGWG